MPHSPKIVLPWVRILLPLLGEASKLKERGRKRPYVGLLVSFLTPTGLLSLVSVASKPVVEVILIAVEACIGAGQRVHLVAGVEAILHVTEDKIDTL